MRQAIFTAITCSITTTVCYGSFRDQLQNTSGFGEGALWFPHDQCGWPGDYYGLLGDLNFCNPVFVANQALFWLAGHHGKVTRGIRQACKQCPLMPKAPLRSTHKMPSKRRRSSTSVPAAFFQEFVWEGAARSSTIALQSVRMCSGSSKYSLSIIVVVKILAVRKFRFDAV